LERVKFKKLKRLKLKTERLVDTIFFGEYPSAFKGRGIEFSEVRRYTEGDDVRLIDWNVTSRMLEPYVRQYLEERELNLYLLLDVSPSQDFGSAYKLKRDVALEFCATVAHMALKHNDKVGLVLFTDRVEGAVRPGKGKKQLMRIIDSILSCCPEGRGSLPSAAFKHLAAVSKHLSVVFLVSDLYTDEDLARPLKILNRQHDVIVARIIDGREYNLPSVGLVEVEDPESGEVFTIDTSNNYSMNLYHTALRRYDERLRKMFSSAGVDYIEVDARQGYIRPLLRFLRSRERKRVR
jgi:uncharacterized protein (DUF58 family)